jgi:hypothetical protein
MKTPEEKKSPRIQAKDGETFIVSEEVNLEDIDLENLTNKKKERQTNKKQKNKPLISFSIFKSKDRDAVFSEKTVKEILNSIEPEETRYSGFLKRASIDPVTGIKTYAVVLDCQKAIQINDIVSSSRKVFITNIEFSQNQKALSVKEDTRYTISFFQIEKILLNGDACCNLVFNQSEDQ